MKLLTKAIIKKLPKLGTTNNKSPENTIAVVKFFNAAGAGTWYATEFDGEDTFFGKVVLHESELGYFSLQELQNFRGRFGLGIERDLFFKPTPLSECH